MSTEVDTGELDTAGGTGTRRLALVLARHHAATGAPPGIDPGAFAAACLTDSYEVVAGLTDVQSGIASPAKAGELLWPTDRLWPAYIALPDLAAEVSGEIDELVVVPADVPDLPALVLAKVFERCNGLTSSSHPSVRAAA